MPTSVCLHLLYDSAKCHISKCRPGCGAYDPKFKLGQDFYTMHRAIKFHHPVFNHLEVIMLTNTPKNTCHWKHPSCFKLAVLTHKICNTSRPVYLSRYITTQETSCCLCSSILPLLHQPITRTHFTDRAFRCTAPTVWNSLNTDTVAASSLSVVNHRLKTLLFTQAFTASYIWYMHDCNCPLAPLKSSDILALLCYTGG